MIYSNYGMRLNIEAYCGKHKPKGYALAMCLVRARRFDPDTGADGGLRHYFVTHLRADGDWQEIDAAVDAAPEVTLKAADLKAAIREAM